MLGNVLKETMLTMVESYAEMGSFSKGASMTVESFVVFHLSSFHLCIHLEASVSLSVVGVRLVFGFVSFLGLLFYCWHQSIDRVRLALTDLAVDLFDVGTNYN